MTDRPARTETVVFQGHRRWSGIWFGVAAFGAASGIVMVLGGAWAGWFMLLVFGPSAIVLGKALRPQANELILDPTGYTIVSVYRRTTTPWSDVEKVGTLEGSHHPVVAVRFTPKVAAQDPESAALAAAMSGYHRTLPMQYGIDAEDLAAMMRGYLVGRADD